jgi:threonine dehydrogenase-like Zn-dependent dehydrogenase
VPGYTPFFRKELTLRISRLYDKDFDEAVGLIESGQVKVQPLITHQFNLEDVEKAIETVANRRENVIKAILHC